MVINPASIQEDVGLIPGLAQWVESLGIACELWYRSQMQFISCVAVGVVEAGSCSSNLTPCLGTSICLGCGPKKQKNKSHIEPGQRLKPRHLALESAA